MREQITVIFSLELKLVGFGRCPFMIEESVGGLPPSFLNVCEQFAQVGQVGKSKFSSPLVISRSQSSNR